MFFVTLEAMSSMMSTSNFIEFLIDCEQRSKSGGGGGKQQLVQGANLRVERLRDKDAHTYICRICNGNEPALGLRFVFRI